jgi:hypothetical protein
VGPPVSEREATTESDKQQEAESDKRSRPAESDKQREGGDGPTGLDREGGGGTWLG